MITKRILSFLPAILISTALFSQVNLTQNLKMYLPFTGNATDASGNGNIATVNGATLTTDRFGTANSAYNFDGINDFISLVNGPGMKPQFPFSFSCWVKEYNTNNNSTNYAFTNDYVDNAFYGTIYTFSSTANGFWCNSLGDGGSPGPSSRNTKESTVPTQIGVWTHFAAIAYSETNIKLYINCAEVPGNYTGTGSGLTYSQTGQGSIGKGDGGPANVPPTFINADLDELRFYDRALTEDEIDALYYYPNPPGTPVTLGNNVQYLCPNGSLTLTPSPQSLTVDQWSDGSAGPSLLVTCPGQYWIAVTDPCGITTYDTVDVQMAPALQQVNLGANQTVCPNQTVTLDATVSGATSYLWTPGNTTQPTLTAGAGTYNVTVSNQCYQSTDAITISVSNPAQQLTADPDTGVCYNGNLVLNASAPVGATLIWSTGDNGTSTTVTNPGIYWVKAIDQCGIVTDTIQVDLGFGCDSTTSLIENFSNNAKALKDYYVNDTWVLTNPPKNATVMVYDVSGRLVYTEVNYTNNWKPDVAEGIYYYVLLSDKQLVTNGRLLVVK